MNCSRTLLRYLVGLGVILGSGCGRPHTSEVPRAVLLNETVGARGCGEGTWFDSSLGQCVNGIEIIGPFTPFVRDTCKNLAEHGTEDEDEKKWRLTVCENEWAWEREWGARVYEFSRTRSVAPATCQPGTYFVEKDGEGRALGLCRADDNNAYGPFPAWMVESCRKNLKHLACEYNRWAWSVAVSIRLAGPNGKPVSGTTPVSPRPAPLPGSQNPRVIREGTTVKLKDVPFYCQLENKIEPKATCQGTAAYMAMKFFGFNGGATNPDGITRRFGKTYLQQSGNVAKALRDVGLKGTFFTEKGTEAQVKSAVNQGYPVIMQNCNSKSGHFVVIVGYDDKGWLVHDPNGYWNGAVFACWKGFSNSGPANGYTRYCNRTNRSESLHYSYASVRRAAAEYGQDGTYFITVVKP